MLLQRVRQGDVATISLEAPDEPTVTLTRASTGEVLGPFETSCEEEGDLYAYALEPEHVAGLEVFEALWEAGEWSMRTYVEVCGGFLFTTAQLAAMKLGQTTVGDEFDDDADLAAMRLIVETALEDACEVAFVPRLAVERVHGIVLDRTEVRVVRTVDGQPASVEANSAGILSRAVRGTVAYEHGMDYPPPRVARAALLLAKRWLVEGPVDDRATSFSTETGTFALVTPGMRGATTDIPEVNATINQYSAGVGVA
jgi:hypothetical protein